MARPPDLARALLELAREDLGAAVVLADAHTVTDRVVGFHAQQAVEKALKAVLAAREEAFPFTHNLAALMQLCADAGAPLPAALAEVDRLTPFGVALRYGMSQAAAVDRATATSWAAAVIDWATELV